MLLYCEKPVDKKKLEKSILILIKLYYNKSCNQKLSLVRGNNYEC